MAFKDALLPEYDHEMATTRQLLERVPEGRSGWQPHPKSMTLGRLAAHLAELPQWVPTIVESTGFDVASPEAQARRSMDFGSRAELLEKFDRNVASGRQAIASRADADFTVPWTLRRGEQTMFTLPRAGALRTFFMNHLIHHRGQMTVYLRLNDVPLPSVYGPTADER